MGLTYREGLLKVTPQDTLMRAPVLVAHIFACSVVIPFNFSAFITGAVSVTCTSSDNLRFDCYELPSSCRITTLFFPFFITFDCSAAVVKKAKAADHSN